MAICPEIFVSIKVVGVEIAVDHTAWWVRGSGSSLRFLALFTVKYSFQYA
jgi:hypothetical protein